MNYNQKELLLIWLDSFAVLSYAEKVNLYDLLKGESSIKAVLKSNAEKLSAALSEKFDKVLSSTDNGYLGNILKRLEEFGVRAITKESDGYPEQLKTVENAPLVLYAKGNVNLLNTEIFAIVGSRKSIPLSVELAKKYAAVAAKCGFTLITGIAEGVDGAVLATAAENGYPVISVLANGLDGVYPKIHDNLAAKVAENGLLISEYPIGSPAQKFHFPVRNRIIAALSDGVLIVSGGEKSGTAYTAEYALEYGKELYAVPYSVGVSSGITPNSFIKRGLATLTDDPNDLYEFFGKESPREEDNFTDEEKAIINSLSVGGAHVEKIAGALNKNVWEITPTLSVLEIKGTIIKSGVNEYSLAKTIQEK